MGIGLGIEEAADIAEKGSIIDLKLQNKPSSTRALRAAVDRAADECSLADEARFDLKLAATEAVTNALKAGRNETVDVTIACEEQSVDIEVLSAGAFAPEVDLRNGRTRELEGGRGIPIMIALVDEVEFARTRVGTRVRMRKRLPSAGESEAA